MHGSMRLARAPVRAPSRAAAAPILAPRPRRAVARRVAQPTGEATGEAPSRPSSTDAEEDPCPVFITSDGDLIEVMCCDFGVRTGVQRLTGVSGAQIPPMPVWRLALINFRTEWIALRRSFRYDELSRIKRRNPPKGPISTALYSAGDVVVRLFSAIDQRLEESGVFSRLLPAGIPKEAFDPKTGGLSAECREIRARLKQLVLSNEAVWGRERAREAQGGGVETPWFVKGVYLALCVFLDLAFDNRPIQRFWFLETVARMPYFSYISMLHLLETLGWWRAGADLRRVHSAEEWNELHHLQIMEALGGDLKWFDRFMGQHAAILYYWILLGMFFFSPQLAYNFSELVEAHAVDTYGEFVDANEELLKSLPPPLVAAEYYSGADLYMFQAFQTAWAGEGQPRRPKIRTLYDVFVNICEDEGEHVKTMVSCQDASIAADLEGIRERKAADAQLPPGDDSTRPRQR